MVEEKKLHRRSIRLQGADYSGPGAYFITICTANHGNMFGRIEDGLPVLKPLGRIV
jgi:putative transposase